MDIEEFISNAEALGSVYGYENINIKIIKATIGKADEDVDGKNMLKNIRVIDENGVVATAFSAKAAKSSAKDKDKMIWVQELDIATTLVDLFFYSLNFRFSSTKNIEFNISESKTSSSSISQVSFITHSSSSSSSSSIPVNAKSEFQNFIMVFIDSITSNVEYSTPNLIDTTTFQYVMEITQKFREEITELKNEIDKDEEIEKAQISKLQIKEVEYESEEDIKGKSSSSAESITKEVETGHIKIVSGDPFTYQKSTFQAHTAEVHSVEEVHEVVDRIRSIPKIAHATHPAIYAYRIALGEGDKERILSDHDDDGESAAGGRLAQMIDTMGVKNRIIIVTRWFGGTLLGPQRFKLINDTARKLLEQETQKVSTDNKKGKKGKS